MKFDYYSDPGHGWVKVPIKELKELEIADKISPWSYMKGDYAYLEEDKDVYIFMMAMKKVGKPVSFREHNTDRQSKIRNYTSYHNKAV